MARRPTQRDVVAKSEDDALIIGLIGDSWRILHRQEDGSWITSNDDEPIPDDGQDAHEVLDAYLKDRAANYLRFTLAQEGIWLKVLDQENPPGPGASTLVAKFNIDIGGAQGWARDFVNMLNAED